MPRLLHMADVHLGARHSDLGPAAAEQRERQFAAFERAIELALAERVDLVLIAGDLFDSNSQPPRSVERAAAQLGRLVQRHTPVVIIPGTHDSYEPGSIYRVFDLAALAGAAGTNLLTVLTDERRRVDFEALGVAVHGFVFATKRAPESPLAGFTITREPIRNNAVIWHVGMIHGSLVVPGHVEQDDVGFTEGEIAASGLDYLALGHWHTARKGRAGRTAWAYSGAPEPVAVDQDGAGQVLLVVLDDGEGRRTVNIEARPVGRTHFQKLELDAATIGSQAELDAQLRQQADPDKVLDARLVGVKPADLDLNTDELESQLRGSFLRVRVRDDAVAPLPEGPMPPADTIIGSFARDLEARIKDVEGRGDTARAAELREALHIGTLLLDDPGRVTLA
jgi:exonuclease SbcD